MPAAASMPQLIFRRRSHRSVRGRRPWWAWAGAKHSARQGDGFVALAENGRDIGFEMRKIGGAHDDAGYAGLGGDVA